MRGILGGTFDPPHIGHLVAAETAYRQLGLDTVLWVPAGSPWQKAGRMVTVASSRWEMTVLAASESDYFVPDDREITRSGPTYTIDTIESFAEEDVVLLLGADSASGIRTWHRWDELVERVRFAVFPRRDTDRGAVVDAVGRPVDWLDMPLIDVSGTLVRDMVSAGRSIRFLVPDPVADVIASQGLYRGS